MPKRDTDRAFRATAKEFGPNESGRTITTLGPYATLSAVKGQVSELTRRNPDLYKDAVWIFETATEWEWVAAREGDRD